MLQCCITSPDELLALIDQVSGHFIVTHELLKAQKIQATGPQTIKNQLQPH